MPLSFDKNRIAAHYPIDREHSRQAETAPMSDALNYLIKARPEAMKAYW